ncbi:MAG: C-type lectin domain-containing protein, partial [Deltaproteobacteria bacterium]|nr:C-type lectin domain-containing protein [Deltaproteobacteria bacterium]
ADTTCDVGSTCSATNELCYSCDDTSIGFEDDAFPSPAGDWTMQGAYTAYNVLPFVWESVLFDVSDHTVVRPSRGQTGDPSDYRFLAFSTLDSHDFWMTFPYPISALSFDVRQYLNWYDATTRYELVSDGNVVLTFAQSPTTSGKVHHAAIFPSPTSFVVIRKIAGGNLGNGMGIDNLVYTGSACGCVPGSCPDDGDGDVCTAFSCDIGTGDCAGVSTAVGCDDGNACTADSCDSATGCVHADTCDDGNGCTVDTCDPVIGCSHTPMAVGDSCDDGSSCTATSECVAPARSASSCDELGWTNAANHGSPTVCGETDNAPLAGCSGPVTYAQAASLCAAAGARLCTVTELAANETRGTGCGYDKYAVWSSTACDSGHWSAPGSDLFLGTDDAPGIPHVCTADSSVRVARCCADVDPTDTTPICEPAPDSGCASGTCTTGACYRDGGCRDAAVDASCGVRQDDSLGCAGSAECEGCVCAKDSLCCTDGWGSDCAACAAGTGDGTDGSCEDRVCADVCGAAATACDSGDPCDATGLCLGGACMAGYACDDGDPCTLDTCTGTGCTHVATLADCDNDTCTVEACEATCDNGGSPLANGCFTVVSQTGTWAEAKAACEGSGGVLARVDSLATNEGLRAIADATCAGSWRVWLGLSDAEVEGLFRWTDGSLPVFTNWEPGAPDNDADGTGQDHVRMQPAGLWVDDGDTTTSNCYACQYPASTTCSAGWTGSSCCPYGGASGSPGCDDTACQDCVCAQDPYCCDTNWDDTCSDCADGGPGNSDACLGSSCGEVCGCTPTYGTVQADCCSTVGAAGCSNPVCADCVCDIDPYCCSIAWDGACTDCAKGNKAECGDACVGACGCDQTSCFE